MGSHGPWQAGQRGWKPAPAAQWLGEQNTPLSEALSEADPAKQQGAMAQCNAAIGAYQKPIMNSMPAQMQGGEWNGMDPGGTRA